MGWFWKEPLVSTRSVCSDRLLEASRRRSDVFFTMQSFKSSKRIVKWASSCHHSEMFNFKLTRDLLEWQKQHFTLIRPYQRQNVHRYSITREFLISWNTYNFSHIKSSKDFNTKISEYWLKLSALPTIGDCTRTRKFALTDQ